MTESTLNPKAAIYREVIPAGDWWVHEIKKGQTLRILDLEGNQAADTLFFSAAVKPPLAKGNSARLSLTVGPAAPTMPVMLDPKGFSPGGEPNWHLNQLRLERAGLDRLPKPAPGQDRPIKGRGGKNRAAKDHSRRNRPPTSQRRTP